MIISQTHFPKCNHSHIVRTVVNARRQYPKCKTAQKCEVDITNNKILAKQIENAFLCSYIRNLLPCTLERRHDERSNRSVNAGPVHAALSIRTHGRAPTKQVYTSSLEFLEAVGTATLPLDALLLVSARVTAVTAIFGCVEEGAS